MRIAIIAIAGLLAACGSSASTPDEPAAVDVGWMRSHARDARAIRDAVVQGDLPGAHVGLAALAADAGPAGAPAAWRPRLDALRAGARRASLAEDVPGTAVELARLSRECGECHAESGAAPSWPDEGEVGAETPAPMARHRWAADRMWEGLVGPAPERYRRGAEALADAPLHDGELLVGTSSPVEVVELAGRVRRIAGQAAVEEQPGARATLYGELLATCASCHRQLSGR